MQRLGFVKWALQLASASRAQSLESLTRAFHAAVTTVKPVPPDIRGAFENYVRQQRRYTEAQTTAEIQDLFLCDPGLPSHTGAITGELERKGYRHAVYVEIPTWASRLQLLRQQSYTLTDRGRALLFAGESQPEKPADITANNPLRLNIPERYISLFCLLDADGDFMTVLYRRLLQKQNFTRSDAGQTVIEALEELRNNPRISHAGPGRLQQIRSKLDRAVEAVKKQSSGGLGPRESIATPRTEPLVDCGVLEKPFVDKYEYTFTDWGRSLLSTLVSADSVTEFLESRLSAAMSQLTHQPVSAPTLQSIEHPYSRLKAGIGYVSVRELALLTVAEALSSPDKELFEISAVEQSLKQAAAQGNRHVRFALGRMGGLAQVRIDPRVFKAG